ncbi:MAG: hypothetical protein C4288_15160 [Leptolyngbya sp. ERB_1_1]
MENQPDPNQQTISGGQGLQVNQPQSQVIQATESTITIQNILSPQAAPTVSGTPQNLPYTGVVAFVGREQELELLHEKLQQRSTVSIAAISGMGGIGKSEFLYCKAIAILHEKFGKDHPFLKTVEENL